MDTATTYPTAPPEVKHTRARLTTIEAGPCRDCGAPTVYLAGSAGVTVVAGSKLENSPVYLHADRKPRSHPARPLASFDWRGAR